MGCVRGPVLTNKGLNYKTGKPLAKAKPKPRYCPWNSVKKNPRGKQGYPKNRYWSKIIYMKIVQRRSGLHETSGGVNHNASWGRLSNATINKKQADWLCGNPCYWYYRRQRKNSIWRKKIDRVKMCNCKTNKAI